MKNLFIAMTILVLITLSVSIYSIITNGYNLDKISICIWSFNTWLLCMSIYKNNK